MQSATLRLAAVAIGQAQVGVAVDAVLHAMPLDGALALLPRRRGALCGVVEHGGKLVPVVDLARWVEVGAAPDAAPRTARILLLREGGRRIGLRVDAVHGLAEVAAHDLMRLHHDGDPDEVFHTVVKARDSGAILSVLDVGRLVALAMAWHQDDGAAGPDAAAAPAVADAAPETRDAILHGLLQAAGVRLAAPVANLAEVLPMPLLRRAGFGVAHCLWRGRHVPVLPADLLAPGAQALPLLAIIEHDGLAIGLPVDAALGMQPFAPPADAPDQDGVGAVCYDAGGQPVLLLDPARLLARYPEAALSRRPAASASAATAARRANDTAHIVFDAGGLASTPIGAIEQVVQLGGMEPGEPLPATLPWRGKAIRLVDLRGADPVDAGQALVVRHGTGDGERHVACVVDRVQHLIPPRAGNLYRLGAVEFISVGEGDRQASYRLLDLADVAARQARA